MKQKFRCSLLSCLQTWVWKATDRQLPAQCTAPTRNILAGSMFGSSPGRLQFQLVVGVLSAVYLVLIFYFKIFMWILLLVKWWLYILLIFFFKIFMCCTVFHADCIQVLLVWIFLIYTCASIQTFVVSVHTHLCTHMTHVPLYSM